MSTYPRQKYALFDEDTSKKIDAFVNRPADPLATQNCSLESTADTSEQQIKSIQQEM